MPAAKGPRVASTDVGHPRSDGAVEFVEQGPGVGDPLSGLGRAAAGLIAGAWATEDWSPRLPLLQDVVCVVSIGRDRQPGCQLFGAPMGGDFQPPTPLSGSSRYQQLVQNASLGRLYGGGGSNKAPLAGYLGEMVKSMYGPAQHAPIAHRTARQSKHQRNFTLRARAKAGTITPMAKVTTQVVPVRVLSTAVQGEMFSLMESHYDGVSRETFATDLADKDDVFLFYVGGRLIGFSTILCRQLPDIPGATILFSGDTVIDQDFWGRSFLQIAFGRYVLERKLRRPHAPLYWMLISKGYKTYLMMRRNYPWSFPQPGREPPTREGAAMDRFYASRFGSDYDPSTGLIRHDTGNYAVKEEWSEPPAELAADPDLRHFLKLNPGCAEGVELACIAEIRLRDYLRIFMKYTPRYFKLVKGGD